MQRLHGGNDTQFGKPFDVSFSNDFDMLDAMAAVTLAIGILTSMFTAITVTRAIVQVVYGGRRINKISI